MELKKIKDIFTGKQKEKKKKKLYSTCQQQVDNIIINICGSHHPKLSTGDICCVP